MGSDGKAQKRLSFESCSCGNSGESILGYTEVILSVLQHTETLNIVFVTYFRILKKAQRSPLLPAVLEGLAK